MIANHPSKIAIVARRAGAAFAMFLVYLPIVASPQDRNPGPAVRAWIRQLYERPLKFPKVEKSGPCPVSMPSHETVPRVGYIFCAGCPWFGKGPAYFALGWYDEAVHKTILNNRMPREDHRFSIKTPWVSPPQYSGPILARGRRLEDGEKLLFRFDGAGNRDLQL